MSMTALQPSVIWPKPDFFDPSSLTLRADVRMTPVALCSGPADTIAPRHSGLYQGLTQLQACCMIRLYHFPLSPYCRKVRLTLAEKKLEVELVEERYWEQSAEFLRRNPAGKVPVLKIDARLMSESQAICEYLEEAYPQPPLMPRDADTRYEVRRLCAWFDDKFHAEVTSKLLYERVHKKIMGLGYPDSKNVKSGATRIKYHIDYLGWLLEQRRWLAGDVMTLADFSAAAHLSSLDYISDVDWNRNPAVKDWYAKIKSRPSFRSLLSDQVPGFPPPAHYADLDF